MLVYIKIEKKIELCEVIKEDQKGYTIKFQGKVYYFDREKILGVQYELPNFSVLCIY